MLLIISQTVNARAFKPFAIVFSTAENLLVGISGALGTKKKPLSKQIMYLRKWCRVISQKVNAKSFQTFAIVVQHPWKTYW